MSFVLGRTTFGLDNTGYFMWFCSTPTALIMELFIESLTVRVCGYYDCDCIDGHCPADNGMSSLLNKEQEG